MNPSIRESFSEFWASNISKLGIVFLTVLVVVSIYTVTTLPLDFGVKYWYNPTYWVDYPKAAQPEWINLFLPEKLMKHVELSATKATGIKPYDDRFIKYYNVSYNHEYSQFPKFITLKISNLVFYDRNSPPIVRFYVTRPDGRTVELYTLAIETPSDNTTSPFKYFSIEPKRILLSGDMYLARSLVGFLYREFNLSLGTSSVLEVGNEKIVFGRIIGNNTFTPLTGKYVFSIALICKDVNDYVGMVDVVLGGYVYGLMGTDVLGRDLSQGLLFGFPVALIIGVGTSLLTTVIGAGLGIVGGYIGGFVDDVIQRFADIVNNIPLLPLLILLSFIFGGRLWLIILVLVFFNWPSLAIIVRSMVLSAKTSQFIEAAVAVGASRLRIMVKHIFPQVAPFILAQMIFFTPYAILAEAALSFLGLGDVSMPTWGQILEYGFKNGAVFLGYWWWILPPGLFIVYSAITFVFIALGMEPVVNPRLRRWR
jgi:peptide/nickel transport system permease protein